MFDLFPVLVLLLLPSRSTFVGWRHRLGVWCAHLLQVDHEPLFPCPAYLIRQPAPAGNRAEQLVVARTMGCDVLFSQRMNTGTAVTWILARKSDLYLTELFIEGGAVKASLATKFAPIPAPLKVARRSR